MIKQPSTNVKMTNVATIRYKINSKMFQIACYRNKALNWRNGVQNDVSEVLQTQEIYENASHGTLAKKSDLNKFFANKTKIQIIEIILSRGQLQITDKERESQQSSIFAQILTFIVEKCVHPKTKRRFTPETIKQAIKQIHFAVKTDQSAKKQALDCIKQLQASYKIIRGDMRIRLAFKKELQQKIQVQLEKLDVKRLISEETKEDICTRTYDIEPSKYRQLNQMCKQNTGVTVQVIVNVVVNQSELQFQQEQFSALQPIVSKKKEEEIEEKMQKMEIKNKKSQEKVLKCSTCGDLAIFMTAADQRAHFKAPWHVENIKRKSSNLPLVSEAEYQFNKDYK